MFDRASGRAGGRTFLEALYVKRFRHLILLDLKNSFTKTNLKHHKICSRHISQVLLPNFWCRSYFWEKRNSKIRIDFFHFFSKTTKNFNLKNEQKRSKWKINQKSSQNWQKLASSCVTLRGCHLTPLGSTSEHQNWSQLIRKHMRIGILVVIHPLLRNLIRKIQNF